MDSKQHLNDYIKLSNKLFIGGNVREYKNIDPSVSTLIVYPDVNYCWGPSAEFSQIQLNAVDNTTNPPFMKESDIMIYLPAGVNVAYGQNIDVKDTLSAGNWNRCKIEWWNGVPTLYVLDTFFLTFKFGIPWPPEPEPEPEPDPTIKNAYTMTFEGYIGSGVVLKADVDASHKYIEGYYEWQDGQNTWVMERKLDYVSNLNDFDSRYEICYSQVSDFDSSIISVEGRNNVDLFDAPYETATYDFFHAGNVYFGGSHMKMVSELDENTWDWISYPRLNSILDVCGSSIPAYDNPPGIYATEIGDASIYPCLLKYRKTVEYCVLYSNPTTPVVNKTLYEEFMEISEGTSMSSFLSSLNRRFHSYSSMLNRESITNFKSRLGND